MRIALGLILSLCTTIVQADIYKYVDEQGHVTLTDKPSPGATRLLGDRPGPAKASKPKASTPSPAHFPKIDRATQRSRDDMRRQLLMQELNSEQQSLSSARANLAAARQKPGNSLDKLNETVRLHEKNVEMLNKELVHLK